MLNEEDTGTSYERVRKYPRVAFSDKIDLVFRGRSYPGYLENLSMNGALVNIDDEISVSAGKSCLLCIYLEEGGKPLRPFQLWSETVHGCQSLVGMRFLGYDDKTRDRLVHLMNRKTSEPKKLRDGLERIQGYLADYHRAP